MSSTKVFSAKLSSVFQASFDAFCAYCEAGGLQVRSILAPSELKTLVSSALDNRQATEAGVVIEDSKDYSLYVER